MNSMMFDRRRAERFAQLLGEADGFPHRHGTSRLDDELADYVRITASLRPDPADGPLPEFRSELRAVLVAAAERQHQEQTAVDGPVGASDDAARGGRGRLAGLGSAVNGRRARVAIVMGLVVGTVALSGMSAASGGALPGDALYGVKRSAENARLAFAASDLDRGALYLQFARNRVGEATDLRGGDLTGVLTDMDTETVAGVRLLTTVATAHHDPSALDTIDSFARVQYPAVTALGAGDRVRRSLELLDRVTERSRALRLALACGAAGGSGDALGPMPHPCDRADQSAPRRPTTDDPTGGSTSTHRSDATPTPAGGTPGPGATPHTVTSIPVSPAVPTPSGSPDPVGGLLGGIGKLLGGGL